MISMCQGKTLKFGTHPSFSEDPWSGESWRFKWVRFELVDLTGDGILDIWVEHAYGVAVISFQDRRVQGSLQRLRVFQGALS